MTKTYEITTETIAKLEAKGFRRWTKGNMDRLYINAKDYGVEIDYYGTGNVRNCYVNFGDERERVSNAEGRRFLATKVYIDLADNTLHVQTATDYESEIIKAVDTIIIECMPEPEPEPEVTAAEAQANTNRDMFRAALIATLDEAIEGGKAGGATDAQLAQAEAARDRLVAAVDDKPLIWWLDAHPSVTSWIRGKYM